MVSGLSDLERQQLRRRSPSKGLSKTSAKSQRIPNPSCCCSSRPVRRRSIEGRQDPCALQSFTPDNHGSEL